VLRCGQSVTKGSVAKGNMKREKKGRVGENFIKKKEIKRGLRFFRPHLGGG